MNPETERARPAQAARAVAVVILWLVTAALGVADLLIGRRLLLEIAYALDVNPWAHSAIDKFGFLFLGICWLISVYVIEYIYGKAAKLGLRKLLRSFAVVSGLLIAFAVLSVGAIFLMG